MAAAPAWPLAGHLDPLSCGHFPCRSVQSQVHIWQGSSHIPREVHKMQTGKLP